MKKKTIYHLIVDKSGSMSNCIDNTISGFNEQVKSINQLENKFPEQEISIGLTTFNTNVSHHYFHGSPATVQELTRESYRPSGGTALLDAIGNTIGHLEHDTDISNPESSTTAVVVIITDGEENSSKVFTLKDIREKIARLEATGRWTFSFMGTTLDAIDAGERMSIKRKNSVSFDKGQMKEEVWDKLSGSMHSYMDKKSKGESLDDLFN